MKMIIFAFFISLNSFAEDINCPEKSPLEKAILDVAVPNCLNERFINSSNKDSTEFCQECGKNFSQRYTGKIPVLNTSEIQKQFLETALKEYKKVLTNNLVEGVKLRALPNTGSTLQKSIDACRLKNVEDFEKDCKSPTALKFLKESTLFQNFKKQVSNELATVLSDNANFNSTQTLLKRNTPACFIPEKQLLYLTSSALEEVFTPSLIEALKKIDMTKYKSVDALLQSDDFSDNYEGNVSEFKSSVKNHPLLNQYFKSPQNFSKFISNLKTPYSVNSVRDFLYSKNSGDNFDSQMAQNCTNTFNSLKRMLCSEEFEQGNIDLNPSKNIKKLLSKQISSSNEGYADSEEKINNNIEVLKYCSNKKLQNPIDLFKETYKLTENLDEKSRSEGLEFFETYKYDLEIGTLNEALCKMNDKTCIEGTFTCNIYKKYKKITEDNTSLDSKLANSSNSAVNELLRSMIGDTSNIEPKTKEILVANGIIPKDDGTLVAQPEIPERQPEYFAKQNTATVQPAAPAQTTIAQASPSSQSARSDRRPANDQYDQGYSYMNDNSASQISNLSDSIKDSNDDLKNIQDEIRRRLTEMPEQRPHDRAEAKKIAREAFKSKGRSISPEQENYYADQMLAPSRAPTSTVSSPKPFETNKAAAVSDSDTQLEKWKKGQQNAALMGMAGAQKVLAQENGGQQAATDPKQKDLTKVALNIAEDPKVNLSEVFAGKLNANDSETQLLKVLMRNKNPFLLQVKAMNFKIIFDEKKNFNLLLESGDRREAERIRPQLEMFLKRLKT